MHKLAEIHLLDIAQLVWDGSDCLVEMMREWSFTLTPRGLCLVEMMRGWSFTLTPRGLCLVEMMTVEFYIDSKGLQLKESLSPSPSSFCC